LLAAVGEEPFVVHRADPLAHAFATSPRGLRALRRLVADPQLDDVELARAERADATWATLLRALRAPDRAASTLRDRAREAVRAGDLAAAIAWLTMLAQPRTTEAEDRLRRLARDPGRLGDAARRVLGERRWCRRSGGALGPRGLVTAQEGLRR